MVNVIEQRTCIKFYFRNEISASKAFEMSESDFKYDFFIKNKSILIIIKSLKIVEN
jgi:hypothetical protein